nr:MAG: ORF1 [Torque teno midi virus]
MAFYWRRRRRFWWGRRRAPYRKRRYQRRRRTRFTRRRNKRAPRRRRRRRQRRYKVRRKKATIPVKQWQPDSIVKCKIKGMSTLVLGAEGKQLVCYTNVKNANTPPKAPGGGGFGCEQFSLESLYTDYKFRKNIWTKSNVLKDLCRYLGMRAVFYRHPETDFIVAYHRQPPFEISKEIYTMCHPVNMMLAKHKIIIPSKFTNPKGKTRIRKYIKPPKQMLTKWFFQEHFAHYPLVMFQATACNFNYSNLGCCNTNQMVTFFYLNVNFYNLPNWSAQTTTQYLPYQSFPEKVYTWNKKQWDSDTKTALPTQVFNKPSNYQASINYTTGFFCAQLLQAVTLTKTDSKQTITATTPLNICRYNPNLDNGSNSTIWLVSTHANSWQKPAIDKTLIYTGYPLYMMLYGFLSYVQYIKKSPDFFQGYVLAMQSDGLLPYSQTGAEKKIIVPLDNNMPNGKAPYDEELTQSMKGFWYPTIYNQLQVLNTIVESGPLVPKYSQSKNSTWELDMFYTFFFKWGGPEITEPPAADPQLQGTYEVPDTIKQGLQIKDPAKNKAASILHPWDTRRGFITTTAFKRMFENLSTDSSFYPDTEQIPKKKRRQTGPELSLPQEENQEVQSSLLSLCEENIFQEPQAPQTPENIIQLIQQQQYQQQQLKHNILRVISEIKEQQNLLKLQTGAMY